MTSRSNQTVTELSPNVHKTIIIISISAIIAIVTLHRISASKYTGGNIRRHIVKLDVMNGLQEIIQDGYRLFRDG